MCESGTPLQGLQNYSNSRVRGYGLLGKLSLIIRQLESDTSKTHQDKCECYGVRGYGLLGKLSLIIRQLEPDTSKTCQDKCECFGVPSRGEVERGITAV